MDVLIVYERKQRELENAILMQIELESRGYSCDIVQFYEASKFNLLNINSPKVILTPHLYNTKSVYRNFARFGHAKYLVNLQYEQVLSKKWEVLGAHTPKGSAQDFFHICWGDEVVNRLIEGGIPDYNIKVIAPLHLDLLRSEYRPCKSKLRDDLARNYGLESTRKWVLFLSSFTYADIELNRLKMNEAAAGTDLSDFPEIHTKSRDELLRWFSSVLEKDTESLFIYRPHPDELNLVNVLKLENNFPNFRVIRERAVKDWIQVSDNIYTWYSTSVVESHFLDKPYSILRPYPLPDSFDSVLLKYGDFITSYSQFESDYFLLDEQRSFAISDQHIKKYYKVDEVSPSFKKMGDFVESLLINEDASKFSFDIKLYLVAKLKSLIIYPVFMFNKLKNGTPILNQKRGNGLFSQISKEIVGQVANKQEKGKIENRLKAQIRKC